MVKVLGVKLARSTSIQILKVENAFKILVIHPLKREPRQVPVKLAQNTTLLMKKLKQNACKKIALLNQTPLLDQMENARSVKLSSTQVMICLNAYSKLALETSS
jgi:hypothetical protein